MGKSKGENAYLVFYLVLALTFQNLLTPAICSRRIQEHPLEEKNFFGPTKHSSSKSPSCTTPSGGSSGPVYHNTPPSYGGGGGSPPSSTPATTVPSPPVTTVPSPPVDNDHNVPPFHPGTCSYWTAHPDKIVAVIGYFGTVGDSFGAGCVFAYGGKNPTLHDAVANKNTDGFSALLREGTAAILNSIACKTFPLTKQQVKSAFVGALVSGGAAAAQAGVFKSANEGQYKS